jgi:hypothetical protein
MQETESLSMSGERGVSAVFEFSPQGESVRRRLADFAVKIFEVNSLKILPQSSLSSIPASQSS